MTDYYAHTPPENDPDRWQTMHDHTHNVADMAAGFATPFGASELAQWSAWLHDVGKYSDEFQTYLISCDAAKRAGRKPPPPGSAEHKCAGTKLALDMLPAPVRLYLAACVLGHHGGLPSVNELTLETAIAQVEEDTPSGEAMLRTAIERAKEQQPELQHPFPSLADIPAMSRTLNGHDKDLHWEMLTRFVFSCLVDADSLDSERHSSNEKSEARLMTPLNEVLDKWRRKLQLKQGEFRANRSGNENVNSVRREVYDACLQAATRPPGLFTLTVPTGGGKTLSGLAFALEHAAAHRRTDTAQRTRIIYAAPYTSIIDQTADTFRKMLGSDSVLEHHSAVEVREKSGQTDPADAQAEDAKEQRRCLMAENWDVPLVVTTTVQLLESLFADRKSRCRKLHNIAGSIIILDEAQTLPPNLLRPLLSGLRALLDQFGVTLVLCTATQPAITGVTEFRETLGEPFEIIPNPEAHFQALKRVTYRVEEKPSTWQETAEEITKQNISCLVVLNTKKDALALLGVLRGEVSAGVQLRHLSTLMCGAHRRQVLAEVKTLLKDKRSPPVILVSTQVIEAGVDIDFPRGLRAMGPLDRIIQTAGRVNREGMPPGKLAEVIVFTPLEGSMPSGVYCTGIDSALDCIRQGGADFDFNTPTVATEYFASLYRSLGEHGTDKEGVQVLRRKLNYPEVAQRMRLIKEQTIPVLVPYHQDKVPTSPYTREEFDGLVDAIREIVDAQKVGRRKGKTLPRALWQKLQPLTVAVYTREQSKLTLSELVPDQLWLWGATYDERVGIGDSVQADISDWIIGTP